MVIPLVLPWNTMVITRCANVELFSFKFFLLIFWFCRRLISHLNLTLNAELLISEDFFRRDIFRFFCYHLFDFFTGKVLKKKNNKKLHSVFLVNRVSAEFLLIFSRLSYKESPFILVQFMLNSFDFFQKKREI